LLGAERDVVPAMPRQPELAVAVSASFHRCPPTLVPAALTLGGQLT
jgi:hypothetical protein